MNAKLQPALELLNQVQKELSKIIVDDVDPEGDLGYEDTLNDIDTSLNEAEDLLKTIV